MRDLILPNDSFFLLNTASEDDLLAQYWTWLNGTVPPPELFKEYINEKPTLFGVFMRVRYAYYDQLRFDFHDIATRLYECATTDSTHTTHNFALGFRFAKDLQHPMPLPLWLVKGFYEEVDLQLWPALEHMVLGFNQSDALVASGQKITMELTQDKSSTFLKFEKIPRSSSTC